METNGKRNLASITSGEPAQSKKTCFPSVKQEGSRSERNLMLERHSMEEEVRKMVVLDSLDHKKVRVELERAKSQPAEYCQSRILDTFKRDVVQEICSSVKDTIWREVGEKLELFESRILDTFKRDVVQEISSSVKDTIRREIREALKHAPCQSAQLVRSSGTCREKDEERNLKLQFITKLPAFLYSGDKLKGVCSNPLDVKLVNANTGTIVASGPESSVKLKVVVLEGGFEREDDDNWTQDEFENSVVKERKGKRPLLGGNLVVKLNRGTGVLGDVEFTDNSKCTRSGQFRIGLQAPPGHCENIREAITEAFTVKENRGKLNKKHFPPRPNDDVWRLKNIARKGPLCKKLNEAGIYKVKEFLQQLNKDHDKLRQILGEGITENKWEELLDHANTCPLNGEPPVCHDYESDHGVGQSIGLTADGVYCPADKFSFKQKEKARELDDETFSGSMQKKRVTSFSSQVSEGKIQNVTAAPAEEYHNVPFSEEPPHAPIPCFQSSPLPPLEGNHVTAETQSTDPFGAWSDGITTDGTSSDADTCFDIDTFFQIPPGADDVM